MTSAIETGRTAGRTLPDGKVLLNGPAWLLGIREQARERFAGFGYPTTRLEEWKYTNVAPIAKTQFRAGEYRLDNAISGIIENLILGVDAVPVVFVNGKYCRKFSNHHSLPKGIKVASLWEAFEDQGNEIERYLAREPDGATPFVALNTASFEDGAFIQVPDGLVLQKPIHLIFVSASDGAPSVSHPRNLILIGELTEASFIETYAGIEGDVYFTNAVTEVIAGENSTLRYFKVQKESNSAFHIATLRFDQSRKSSVLCESFSFGGALVRNDLNLRLAEGAEGALNGLYLVTGKQHVDNHTAIDHAEPHAASRELYKGILDGRSSAVFNGKVIVRKDAQKTDAKQTNRNLLLSEEAVINTKPELQIYADDVRCTHGATIGQLEENALFYLRSRGIGEKQARQILIHAFAQEIVARVQSNDLRSELEQELDRRLSTAGGEVS